jgi:Common central domain of tyrosinase
VANRSSHGELIYRFEELIREIDPQLSRAAGPPDHGRDVWPTNSEFVNASTWEAFNDSMQGCELGSSNNYTQGLAHSYIGGTLGNADTSFREPFVFLLHSNVDRLFVLWQLQNR